jgi:hypothetical protein
MASRRGVRGRRARNLHLKGAALLIGIGIAILAVILVVQRVQPPRLGADLCPESGPTSLLAILVDSTDALSEAQLLDVRNRIVSGIQRAPAGTGVQIWRVTAERSGLPEPIAPVMCRPEREPDPLYQNVKTVKANYAKFEHDALAQVDTSLAAGPQTQSPILEAMQAVTLKTFNAPRYASVPVRTLWLVSDLRQNTPLLSFINDVPSFGTLKQHAQYDRLRSDLSRVSVKVLFLSRPSGGVRALVQFWQEAIGDFGGTLAEVERITG